ncbi:MAG TPA: phosphomannomutase/phosphoglucomutase, partial [Pseudonocardia sp.]|nr:phosphomannomutase/phosphoglucomutase [Pseudonocardia sp.]
MTELPGTAPTATDLSAIIKAYDIRGVVGEQLDEELARALGAAMARMVGAEGARGVVIGRDMRDSSPALAAAFAEGVTGQGLDVVAIGLASTDMLYYASGSLEMPGAMFT